MKKSLRVPEARTEERKKNFYKALAQRQDDLTLVLDNIHDPHNVSAILRSCDAFGVSSVNLYYTLTAYPQLGKKSSASANKWVETHRHNNIEDLIKWLKSKSFQLLATTFSSAAKPLRQWDFLNPTAIILGNEHSGTSPELLSRADGELYIPMHGLIQSFNVSVAAGIILSEAARQREDAGWYDMKRMPESEFAERYRRWLQM